MILGENRTDDCWITYVAFSSDLEITYDEFFLYDANAIVASVGGGLGMFLGVSCLGVILEILKLLLKSTSLLSQDAIAQPERRSRAKAVGRRAKARL